jgi:uncharacterized membrane protein
LEPKLTIVHTIPVHLADAAAKVPPAPDPAASAVDQPGSSQPAPRPVHAEKLLKDAPAASNADASAAAATPAVAGATTGGGKDGTSSWLGVLLMALGGVALLIASLRRMLWPMRSPDAVARVPVAKHG